MSVIQKIERNFLVGRDFQSNQVELISIGKTDGQTKGIGYINRGSTLVCWRVVDSACADDFVHLLAEHAETGQLFEELERIIHSRYRVKFSYYESIGSRHHYMNAIKALEKESIPA